MISNEQLRQMMDDSSAMVDSYVEGGCRDDSIIADLLNDRDNISSFCSDAVLTNSNDMMESAGALAGKVINSSELIDLLSKDIRLSEFFSRVAPHAGDSVGRLARIEIAKSVSRFGLPDIDKVNNILINSYMDNHDLYELCKKNLGDSDMMGAVGEAVLERINVNDVVDLLINDTQFSNYFSQVASHLNDRDVNSRNKIAIVKSVAALGISDNKPVQLGYLNPAVMGKVM